MTFLPPLFVIQSSKTAATENFTLASEIRPVTSHWSSALHKNKSQAL